MGTIYKNGIKYGGGLPTPESKDKLLLSVENEETSELEWSQVDKDTVGSSPFIGTEEEWNDLSLEEKAKYKIVNFLDDGEGSGVIDDEKTSTDSTWSSKKINDSLVDIESDLGEIIIKREVSVSGTVNANDTLKLVDIPLVDGYQLVSCIMEEVTCTSTNFFATVPILVNGQSAYRFVVFNKLSNPNTISGKVSCIYMKKF